MPREAKGARLHLRKRKGYAPIWEIRDDGDIRKSTGTSNREQAEEIFAQYLNIKRRPSGPSQPDALGVSFVLSIYGEEHAMTVAAPERVGYAIDALERFWADLSCADITGNTCRRYQKHRLSEGVSVSTARRELGVLRAAVNHCHREGYLITAPAVTLPPKPPSVDRWLTRQEAAWLLRAARALHSDGRHLQDFILCGLYTGSRKATILGLRFNMPSPTAGHIDTVHGVLYRRPQLKKETAKRQTPARLPPKYLAHLRRQESNNRQFVVQNHQGHRVADIRKGWSRAVRLAETMAKSKGIDLDLTMIAGGDRKYITPHVLKHTAVTWSLQNGSGMWDAASFFATSVETIEKTYGHHSPDHQSTTVEALNRKS